MAYPSWFCYGYPEGSAFLSFFTVMWGEGGWVLFMRNFFKTFRFHCQILKNLWLPKRIRFFLALDLRSRKSSWEENQVMLHYEAKRGLMTECPRVVFCSFSFALYDGFSVSLSSSALCYDLCFCPLRILKRNHHQLHRTCRENGTKIQPCNVFL